MQAAVKRIHCGDGRHEWVVGEINAVGRTQLQLKCRAPDYFRDDRGDGTQGWVKSPWTSVSINLIDANASAELIFEGDHLDDGENGGRQNWNALAYQRDGELLIINFEPDGGFWYCRVLFE